MINYLGIPSNRRGERDGSCLQVLPWKMCDQFFPYCQICCVKLLVSYHLCEKSVDGDSEGPGSFLWMPRFEAWSSSMQWSRPVAGATRGQFAVVDMELGVPDVRWCVMGICPNAQSKSDNYGSPVDGTAQPVHPFSDKRMCCLKNAFRCVPIRYWQQ